MPPYHPLCDFLYKNAIPRYTCMMNPDICVIMLHVHVKHIAHAKVSTKHIQKTWRCDAKDKN
jgi:hypothetical protein